MTRWRVLLARFGGRTPESRDAVVAVALVLVGFLRLPLALLLNGGSFPASGGLLALANLVATADLATIALRRRAPLVALATATAVAVVSTALPALYQLTGLGLVVCAYTVGTLLPRGRVALVLGVGAIAHAAGGIVAVALGGQTALTLTYWGNAGHSGFDLVLASVASYGLPGLLGLYVQTRRAYVAEVAARERDRIARDLHDIAAHDLSAIVVQAGAADRLLDRDPAAARETLRAIRAQGRSTLLALRGLVGIMREQEQPSLAPLVEAARRAGMTVELDDTAGATPAVAYRVVQEALANARQHAPGARVTVVVRDATLTVHNGPAVDRPVPLTDGGGHGIASMRERVQQAGGTLTAGPTADGGWQVEAHWGGT